MDRDDELIEVFFAVCSLAVIPVLVLILGSSFLMAVALVLHRVSPENRRMEPGSVWLNLIPVFNLVWATVTVERVAESLRNEFRERGMDGSDEQYGRRTGLTLLALLASGILFYPAFICYPIAFFYWIGYWRQMNRYAGRLKSGAYSPPPIDEGW
jgi:hypothetical protein